jgi:hypothetical protein
MANQLTYEIRDSENMCRYIFELDDNKYFFDVVKFEGIEDYNKNLEVGEIDIFAPLNKIKNKIFKVVSYDWDIEKNNDRVNIFQLVRVIEFVGKEYVLRNWPDVIFYQADDKRLHKIYQRMFPSFGYEFMYEIDKHYVFLRDFGSAKMIT